MLFFLSYRICFILERKIITIHDKTRMSLQKLSVMKKKKGCEIGDLTAVSNRAAS